MTTLIWSLPIDTVSSRGCFGRVKMCRRWNKVLIISNIWPMTLVLVFMIIPCKALHLEGFGNVPEIEEGAVTKCHKMSNWPTHHPVQTKTAINGASVSFTYIIHERLLLLKHSACCYLKSASYPSSPILPHTMLSPWTATEHFEPFQTVSWSEANLDLDSF